MKRYNAFLSWYKFYIFPCLGETMSVSMYAHRVNVLAGNVRLKRSITVNFMQKNLYLPSYTEMLIWTLGYAGRGTQVFELQYSSGHGCLSKLYLLSSVFVRRFAFFSPTAYPIKISTKKNVIIKSFHTEVFEGYLSGTMLPQSFSISSYKC
jgi:hypothetical protein